MICLINRRQADAQEKRITKSLREIGMEARRQMASGSVWFAKSDVVSSLFQIEAKTRAAPSKSITIQKQWMEKIHDEALQANKTPALVVSFGDGNDYYVVNSRDFLSLMEELMDLRRQANG